MAAATASAAPRYAPEDPTLPKPWKGLVDGKTGYLYFWNPETNITQYERPSLAPPMKPSSMPPSSAFEVQQSFQSQHQGYVSNGEDDKHSRGSGGVGAKTPEIGNNGMISSGAGIGSYSSKGSESSSAGGGMSVEQYCRRHEISVTGDKVPAPFTSFEATGFPPEMLREVHRAGFSAPTPIQAQSWPIALQGRDIVAVAKTGSGKTCGYLFPGFMHIKHCRKNPQMGPTVLVLSPTRELATQIQDEAAKFGKSSKISCVCLYGGAPRGPQLRDLDKGADIVVATPGRLNDILEMRKVSLGQVSYLVLDEADRMLDMGFEPQIQKIVKEVPIRRQTLMYTATWPKEVRKIAADFMVNPVQINIGNVDELVANKSITQYVEVLTYIEKQKRLEQILRSQEPGSKIIIFCSTKKMCDQLARNINRQFGAAAIHGDKSQAERDNVLSQFRNGRNPVLVATDVAARGLDIKDIRVVVNFDFPNGAEDYVHRIGRTGRAGASGVAYTFLGDQDAKHASDLIKVLEGANQKVPQEIREMATRGGGMNKFRRWGPGSGGRDGGRGGGRDSGYGAQAATSWHERAAAGRGSDRDPSDRYHANNGRYGTDRGRSRSRSPQGRGWNDSRNRSRSPVQSFHRLAMEKPRALSNPFSSTQSREDFGGSASQWGN